MRSQNTQTRTRMIASMAGALIGLTAAAANAEPIAIEAQQVIAGLTQPTGVYARPGDTDRIFILQQSGQILLYDLNTSSVVGTYLDISATGLNLVTTVTAGTERGLLGLALHPDFASNGFFYINYTSRTTGATVVRRYTANAPFMTSTSANTGTGTDLIIVAQDFSNHNGGSIHFGPDNMLYVFMGDGGSANDPNNRAQDDTQQLGKILRLDVNDTSAGDGDGMFVPDNNPFRALGSPRDKVWAKGTRNPWRSTFDRVTGDMWVADVGQDTREEVNFQPAIMLQNPADGNSTILNTAIVSRNYGWDCREGLIACPTGALTQGCDPNAGGYTNPIVDYTHASPSLGCSISGGYVYRGSAIPALDGLYIYADYCTATTHRLLGYNGNAVTFHADIAEQLRVDGNLLSNITSYGEDAAGELYVCVAPANGAPGTIYKIVPFNTPCGCPCEAPGAQRTLFSDQFATNTGWTVQNDAGLTDGPWIRGQVLNDISTWQYDPIQDFDGNGWAFVTDNVAGNSDVDNGTTRLMSPALDFTQGGITICYSYFLKMNAPDAGDGMVVEVSSNGTAGPWTAVRTYATDMSTRWTPDAITQSQLTLAGITNTTNMRVRFSATDTNVGNIVEAGLDDFKILTSNVPDCNNNGVDDLADISGGFSLDANMNQIPDECEEPDCLCDWDGNNELGVPDIFAFLSSWFAAEPAADFDGQNGIGVPDIFSFLACWFAGCP